MCQVNARECVATKIGLSAQLRDDREDEAAAVLLIFIAEVAIKVSHDCRSIFVLGLDVFNYPRAVR